MSELLRRLASQWRGADAHPGTVRWGCIKPEPPRGDEEILPTGPETAMLLICALSTAGKMCPLEIQTPSLPHTWVWGLQLRDLCGA